jgi:hypothetical protein
MPALPGPPTTVYFQNADTETADEGSGDCSVQQARAPLPGVRHDFARTSLGTSTHEVGGRVWPRASPRSPGVGDRRLAAHAEATKLLPPTAWAHGYSRAPTPGLRRLAPGYTLPPTSWVEVSKPVRAKN